MTRSPRETFQKSPYRKPWEEFTMTAAFDEASRAALLQMAVELPESPSPSCMDPHSQMVGARKVLALLATIHKPEADAEKPKAPRLNYEAGV